MKRYLVIATKKDCRFTDLYSFSERAEAYEKAVSKILDGYTVKIRDNATGLEDRNI